MEYTFAQIKEGLEQAPDHRLVLWGTCFLKREAVKRTQRNLAPVLCELDLLHIRSWQNFRVTEIDSGAPVQYEGAARGSEIRFFSTRQEAIDYYNERVDKALDDMDKAIIKLQKERKKMQASKL